MRVTAMIFAERLNEALKDKNMKQVDLLNKATEMGIKLGKSQISQYVSGKTYPRDNVLKFLAKVLEVDEAWLGGINDTSPSAPDKSHRCCFRPCQGE